MALLGWGLAGLAGCAPCESDGDCGEQSYCSDEGLCAQDCRLPQDCPSQDQSCTEYGQCVYALAPQMTWVSPAAGSAVEAPFSVEVEVRFVGEQVTVTLDRDPLAPGEPCTGFAPQTQVIPGDPARETVARVIFDDLEVAGAEFGLRATGQIREVMNTDRSVAATLRGEIDPDILLGVEIDSPAAGRLPYSPPISVPLEVTLPDPVDRVWAFSEPLGAPSTPRRTVALDTDVVDRVRLPIVRGPQQLQLEIEQGGTTRTCAVGIDTEPAAFSDLEMALFFDGDEPGDLDLWVYAEPDEAAADECTVQSPGDYCREPYATVGLREWGEEALRLGLEDGVYGIAVAPGAVSGPQTASVRISRGDNHLAWLGPRTVISELGNVWLAGRIYIVGGAVSVEPLSRVVTGLPTDSPGAG